MKIKQNLKGIEGDRIYLIHEKVDPQIKRPPRFYIQCPRRKSSGMRSTEICFCVCKYYHKCKAVQSLYVGAGYKLKKKNILPAAPAAES